MFNPSKKEQKILQIFFILKLASQPSFQYDTTLLSNSFRNFTIAFTMFCMEIFEHLLTFYAFVTTYY